MIKRRVYQILEPARGGDRASRVFDYALLSLILLNILAMILESIRSVHERWHEFLAGFELISVAAFSVEYLLRLWSCTADERYHQRFGGRAKFMFSPLALIDLVAILPAYIPMVNLDLRFLRALRLFRILRVGKLFRYSQSLGMLGAVFHRKREELVITMSILGLLLLLSSTAMYFAEREAQPTTFTSIPVSMWWSIGTLTTVGSGDMAPVTVVGRLLGGIVALLGVAMVALPTGIVGAGFMEYLEARKKPPPCCPHCGKEIPPI